MDDKIYVFISHSHRDLDKVRVVRNFLEENAAEPILFFLKSKTDHDEIVSLIKDEIDARLWFIYCDSKNARNSQWVSDEVAYVHATGKENCTTIDLDSDFDEYGQLKESAKQLLRNTLRKFLFLQTFYVSYLRIDRNYVSNITEILNKYGIKTITNIDEGPGVDFNAQIAHQIKESHGTLLFLSKDSIQSEYQQHEVALAAHLDKKIFPVFLVHGDEDIKLPDTISYLIEAIQFIKIDISSYQTIERDTLKLVYSLLKRID